MLYSTWKSEDNFWDPVLQYCVSPEDGTQAVGQGSKCLYSLRHLSSLEVKKQMFSLCRLGQQQHRSQDWELVGPAVPAAREYSRGESFIYRALCLVQLQTFSVL